MNNGIRFTCTRPGDVATFDPVENVGDVVSALSTLGTWERTAQNGSASPFATYTWKADPVYVDSIRKAGLTVSSTMTVGALDTVRVQGRFAWTLASALRTGSAGALTIHHDDTGVGIPWWSALREAPAPPPVRRPTPWTGRSTATR